VAVKGPIRVLCVDDHRLMREGIARIVAVHPDMEVVAQASNGDQAVAQFLMHRPDVTLMDLRLPVAAVMDGTEAIRSIRRHDEAARIVVLTMYQGDEDIRGAFEAGAMGYLLKDSIPDDLIHVIREVYAGRRVVAPEIQQVLEQRASQPVVTLRERQVLELIAIGMRNKEIASALGITPHTIGAHVKNIYSKLRVHDRAAALGEAIRRGLVHMP
jgi:DNA-binding NarL/FixJ family response regulator